MNKILNDKGFSLLEVVIAMGLMGAFVMGFINLSDKIVESERKMMDLMEMNELMTRVRYTLNDTVACDKTMSVKKIDQDKYQLPLKLQRIVDRRDKEIISTGIAQGRVLVKQIRVNLEPIEGEHIQEEPRFVNLFFDVEGRSRYTKNKVFKITVPVLLAPTENDKFEFLYCDSIASGVAQEMTNQIMKKMCDSLNVPYDPITGECDMAQMNFGTDQLGGDNMINQIQQLMNQQLNQN